MTVALAPEILTTLYEVVPCPYRFELGSVRLAVAICAVVIVMPAATASDTILLVN
jgi:hypothetical protein